MKPSDATVAQRCALPSCRLAIGRAGVHPAGSTGHRPVPGGDSPPGMEQAREQFGASVFSSHILPVPSGHWPDGTGESPVPPILTSEFRFNSAPCRQSGFSLLEIMVAVSLLAVMIVGLLAMFYQVQRAFRSGTAQVDVMEAGRAVINLLSRELAETTAATPYADGTYFDATNLIAVIASGYAATYQDLPGSLQRENVLMDLSFIRRVNDDWVGTAYRMSDAGAGVGTLYRFTTNSTDPVALSQLVSRIRHDDLAFSNSFHRVADGIVHFLVEAYDTNGIVARDFYFPPPPAQPMGYAFTSNALSAYLDLEIGVLEPATLERFKARAGNDPTFSTAKSYLAEKASRVQMFRQRIVLRAPASDTRLDPP